MIYFQYILVGIFGLIVGSFLNSVIYRLQNTETIKGIVKQRSHCPKCKKTLRFWDLIPLVSFIFLYAKCKYCKKPISWQYPLVEAVTAGAFLLIFFQYQLSWEALVWALLAAILIVIFTYDLLHSEIPVVLVYVGLPLAAILVLLNIYSTAGFDWMEGLNYVYGAVAIGGFLGLLVLVSREKWMGIGDIWLGAFIGLLLTWQIAIVAGFFAFIVGSIVSLALIAARKKKFKDKVPFGPFLIIGLVIALIWGEQIINWYLRGTYLGG